MPDISYKKFSELAATTSLIAADVIPVVTTTGGNNSKQITYGSFAQTVSSTLIGPFTTTITAVEPASAGKWNNTYTTVNANSASWGTGGSTSGFTIFKQISSVASPNNSTTVHALSIISSQTNVDIAVPAKGTGATLAQIPDDTATGGAKRGAYATDWQKIRVGNTQVASGDYSTIGGGFYNTASGTGSFIGGGSSNTASGANAVVGGGSSNTASGAGSFIGSGYGNTASGTNAVVGGGSSNQSLSSRSMVVGGSNNISRGVDSIIGGGSGNTASGDYSIVGGGYLNGATGLHSIVIGGSYSTAGGDYSAIVGGSTNYTGLSNTFIIGSNITAVSADYTYVNNISSQGTVAANNFKYSTSTATFASGPIFIDAALAQLHHITYTGATTPVDLHISNIYNTPGRDIKIHIVNRAAAGRVLTPKYVSTSPAITGGIPLTTTGIVASAANTASMATNAIATIWVANIGGNIVGSFG